MSRNPYRTGEGSLIEPKTSVFTSSNLREGSSPVNEGSEALNGANLGQTALKKTKTTLPPNRQSKRSYGRNQESVSMSMIDIAVGVAQKPNPPSSNANSVDKSALLEG